MSLPEDKIEATLSSQQSTYEHIQSMSATFLSVTFAAIAAIAGLISADIIEPQIFDIPDTSNISSKIVLISNKIYLPEQVVSNVAELTLLYSSIYLAVALILIIISTIYFISCLNVKPLYPEKYTRVSLEDVWSISKNSHNKIEKEWIEENIEELDNLVSSFKQGKKLGVWGIILSLFSVYGFIGVTANEPNSFIFLIWFTIPLFVIAFLLGYLLKLLRFLRYIWGKWLKIMFEMDSIFKFIKYQYKLNTDNFVLYMKYLPYNTIIKSVYLFFPGIFSLQAYTIIF